MLNSPGLTCATPKQWILLGYFEGYYAASNLTSRSPKRRKWLRGIGLRGAALLAAVERLKENGVNYKQLWIRCGYRNPSLFKIEYQFALHSRAVRNTHPQSSGPSRDLKENQARLAAQRKLIDGKDLDIDEFNSLPDWQKRAFEKDLRPLPKGQPIRRARRRQAKPPESKPPARLPLVKRPKLVGAALLDAVLDLSRQEKAEIIIAIKCGYSSEEIGPFRTQLARAAGCERAPMERILAKLAAQ